VKKFDRSGQDGRMGGGEFPREEVKFFKGGKKLNLRMRAVPRAGKKEMKTLGGVKVDG